MAQHDERARVLEERNRLLHETFDETMNAVHEEGVEAAKQQVVTRPQSGSVSGEAAMSESDGE